MPAALRVASASARRYASALRGDAARLLSALGLGRSELSIIIVDDPTIQGLNREFRGKDAPTDVLSFSQVEVKGAAAPDPGNIANTRETILGDVVISIDTALRQAAKYEVTPAARLRTLLIHGVLHLIGYDHERSLADARRMFARERELVAAISAGKTRPRPAKGPKSVARRTGKRGSR